MDPQTIARVTGVLFGVFDAGSPWQAIATIPEFLWELLLGLYLTFKGFRPSPIIAPDWRPTTRAAATPEFAS